MLAPVTRLNKTEINRIARWRCSHGHSGLEHYTCWLKENPLRQRIGFFDIESSHLKANFGVILSWCILVDNKIIHRAITPKELRTCLDREVVRECVKTLQSLDRVVTYYGKYFDIPFVRSRALKHNIDFMNYGELMHDDVWFMVRSKLKLHSNRQEVACKFLLGDTEKTHLDPDIWMGALMGDQKKINWILDHNKRDVRDLKRLYEKVYRFTRKTESSV